MSTASLASQLRPKFFRTGHLPKVKIPSVSVPSEHNGPNQAHVNTEAETQSEVPYIDHQTRQAFAKAVRQKERWYFKVLEQKELATKWMDEAGLPDTPEMRAVITDLKREARRICYYDYAIRLEPLGLPERSLPVEEIHSAVEESNIFLRTSQYGITAPKLYENVGAYIADDVVPRVLHEELARELDTLANREPKDFHPGSGGKVQDIIHPSLYPYKVDSTLLHHGVNAPQTTRGRFRTEMHPKLEHDYDAGMHSLKSSFAWIPTIFTVSHNGSDVSIDGYINGLGSREQYPTLFRLLEETFKTVMPLLERTVTFQFRANSYNSSYYRYKARHDYWDGNSDEAESLPGYKELLAQQDAERKEEQEQQLAQDAQKTLAAEVEREQYLKKEAPKAPPVSIWAGKRLKVIVKAANYVLHPGQEYSGTWHIEGMPHERIVASAIYYYDRDPSIVDAGLYLRRKRDGLNREDWPHDQNAAWDHFNFLTARVILEDDTIDECIPVEDAPSDYGVRPHMSNLPSYVNVGVIFTISEDRPSGTGRIITFPNWVQHCVHSVYNNPAATEPATRKILCFFLVDDSDPSDVLDFPGFTYLGLEGNFVLTTSDIPAQVNACNIPTLTLLLRMACRQRTAGQLTLPPELIERIVELGEQGEGWGMSREDAEVRRRKLMTDRKVHEKGVNDLWKETFSLCEH